MTTLRPLAMVFAVYAMLDAKKADDRAEKLLHLNELKAQLESYQQDEDDAAIDLAEAQRNYEYEKAARESLEIDIAALKSSLSE